MKNFDAKIRKRFKDDHGIELLPITLKTLRKSVEHKIINMIKRVEILHTDYFELFPQYSKFYRRGKGKIISSIDESSPIK